MNNDKELELVYQITLDRQSIANLKNQLSEQIWFSHPRKHRALNDEYETKIKRYSYRLADNEKRLNKIAKLKLLGDEDDFWIDDDDYLTNIDAMRMNGVCTDDIVLPPMCVDTTVQKEDE